MNDETTFEQLVEFFYEASKLTGKIQDDISIHLVANQKIKETLKKQLGKSEEEMQKIMDEAVNCLVRAMPLASMNRSNIFMQAIAMHANITSNPLLHRVFEEVNRRSLNYE